MTMRTRLIVITAAALLCSTAAAAALELSGKQTRGVPGRDAKREGKAMLLKKTMTIRACSGERMDGFWLENDQGKVLRHASCNAARGKSVPAGTWWVVPNLQKNADTASVKIGLE